MKYLFVVFFIALTGCALKPTQTKITDDDLLITDSTQLFPKEAINQEEVNEDIDTLLYAFNYGYGGRKYIDQKAFKEALSQITKLKNEEIQTPKNLCNHIVKIMCRIKS